MQRPGNGCGGFVNRLAKDASGAGEVGMSGTDSTFILAATYPTRKRRATTTRS